MSEPRRVDPVPLGGRRRPALLEGPDGPRADADRLRARAGYVLARRLERELAARDGEGITLEGSERARRGGARRGRAATPSTACAATAVLQDLDLPIILLVGGATGTGKSTIATEAAYRLGITRVTSTDFVRQTMRAFFSQEFMPSLHYSSFEAPRRPPTSPRGCCPASSSRRATCWSACAASLDRALHEGWSMVVEGVHLVPGMIAADRGRRSWCSAWSRSRTSRSTSAHFHIRDQASEGVRALDKYVDALRRHPALQDYIVERARRDGVPVIENRTPRRRWRR